MATIRPIPITTGGALDLRDIIGRDQETEQIVRQLRGDSVLLTGDRRIGKTQLSRLVEDRLVESGLRVARVSAERTTLADFQDSLARALQNTVTGRLRDEIGQWNLKVKAGVIEASRAGYAVTFDEIVKLVLPSDGEGPLILIIDEVPVLATAMEKLHPGSGADLLVMLRRIRQEAGRRLSMLLLGSMGFHHVAADAPGALNDVVKHAVGPISADDGVYLARCLMLGAGVDPSDDQLVAETITSGVDRVPFYIQHLVKACQDRRRGQIITPSIINQLIEEALIDTDDPWYLQHDRNRVLHYFAKEGPDLVHAVLDVYARAGHPLEIDTCRLQLAADGQDPLPSRSALVNIVERLEQDHYLVRRGRLSEFRGGLARRSWLAMLR